MTKKMPSECSEQIRFLDNFLRKVNMSRYCTEGTHLSTVMYRYLQTDRNFGSRMTHPSCQSLLKTPNFPFIVLCYKTGKREILAVVQSYI